MKLCQDIMHENPAVCLALDTVQTIAQRMRTENIDFMVVVESHLTNKLIGIITDRDITLRVVGKGLDNLTTRVSEVMTQNPKVCHPHDEAEAALKNMATREIRRLPVVDDAGILMGIIVQTGTIQARVSIRLDNEHKVSAFTIKDSFDNDLIGFAEILAEFVKRIKLMNTLSEALTHEEDDATLSADTAG